MRAVALSLSISVALFGCFPKDPHARMISKFVEGGVLLTGVGLAAYGNTGANCDTVTVTPGMPDPTCAGRYSIASNVGLTMILAGLLGFVATISTAEDDAKPPPPAIDIKVAPTAASSDAAALTLPPGVSSGSAAATAKPDTAAATTNTAAPNLGAAAPHTAQ